MVIRFALMHVARRCLCPEGSMPDVIPSPSGRPRFRLQAHVGPLIRHSREACPRESGERESTGSGICGPLRGSVAPHLDLA
jgi:hypothetical protein